MYRLFEKIDRCRLALVEWSRNTFSNIKSELQVKQSALEELSDMNDPNKLPEIRELKNNINTLETKVEVHLVTSKRQEH